MNKLNKQFYYVGKPKVIDAYNECLYYTKLLSDTIKCFVTGMKLMKRKKKLY